MKVNAFRKSLEKVSHASFLERNSLKILKDGSLAFDEVFRAVEEGRKIICLEYYIFRDDQTGWALADLLVRKSRQGVQVNLIYDHFGSISTSDRFWNHLQSNGVRVLPFHPPQGWTPNLYFHRNHRKLAVIDGRVAFTGGLNVGDEYRGYFKKKLKGWRDTAVRVQGPIAQVMMEAFQESWRECGGAKIEGNLKGLDCGADGVENVAILPLLSSSRQKMRAMRNLLRFSLSAAQKSIHLTMAYFIPTHKFLRSLVMAARRGVDVRIILPGQTDLRLLACVVRSYYPALLREGVEIYHYQPRVLHAKTMVFDHHWTIIGSINLDSRSFNYNYECGVGVLDPALGLEMEKIFTQDLAESEPVRSKDLLKWPFHERAIGMVLSWFDPYL